MATEARFVSSMITYAASYDLDGRRTDARTARRSDGTVLYAEALGYDAVGNITTVSTTLPAGTDNQAFCYDERNRLTWASSTGGTPPCGGSLTSGTLTSAAYTQSFAYDALDRLTSGPSGGTMTYGDSTHLDAVTAISSSRGYGASYDASGNMACRATTSSQTCASGQTPTGQMLTYDNEGRLTGWTGGSGSTATEAMAYDGEGNRVALVVNGGTPTYYVGHLEEVSGSTITKYFAGIGGLPTAERMGTGGSVSYLASDGLGSVSEALDGSGTVTFQQLYTPAGAVRFSTGAPPTSYAFTGQRADKQTGLDYYNARYYDPTAQTFTSADRVSDGLNRYAYVHDNPETLTDPSGNRAAGCVHEDGEWYCPTPPPTPPTTPPPPPPPPTGCQATHDCDGSSTDTDTPVLATTDDIGACFSFGYPAWCAKYLTYEPMCQEANGRPMPCQLTSYWDPIKIYHQVDFIILQASAGWSRFGFGPSVEVTNIYLTPTHSLSDIDWLHPQWQSMGLVVGWGLSAAGDGSALLGFGVLLTEGSQGATSLQIATFLNGGSLNLGGDFLFHGITQSANSNGVAIISTISTNLISGGIGGGIGMPGCGQIFQCN